MERITRNRALWMLLAVVLVLGFFSVRLYTQQVAEDEDRVNNVTTYTTRTRVRAARGDIVDTNGNVLVTNRASYDLVFNHYVILGCGNPNERLLELALLCRELGIEYDDHFPVSESWPFTYTLSDLPTSWQAYFQAFLVNRGDLDSDITAPLLMQALRKSYGIPADWSDEDARLVIGLRYELTLRNGITNLPNYVFLEDTTDSQLSAILELGVPGLNVETSMVRVYKTEYAAHVLGYIGAMSGSQWEQYRPLGYEMDALVGQSGFELAFEEYLHGTDGIRVDVVTKDGTVVNSYYDVEPQAGSNVEVSIDLMMQIVAEDALANMMAELRDPLINTADGLDCEGAAVVAIDTRTGQVLVCASYPTYDPSKLFTNWNEIVNAPYDPLINRALNNKYPPGSAFKPAMVIAGIDNGYVTREEQIADKGVFTKYSGFRPACMYFTNYGNYHTNVDAAHALKVSCNYYFYVLADRMGNMNKIDAVGKALGLGEYTGVELYETRGQRANPETKAKLFAGTNSAGWYAADQVMAGIGQSFHRYSPMQLASYAMGLGNQGVRYKATFLDRVLSPDYHKIVMDNPPQILSQLEISNTAYDTYLDGMIRVSNWSGGTACSVFKNYPIEVAGKTGTAEDNPNYSDNASFICFAPANDPRIAIAVYGERTGGGGGRLAGVAKAILDMYFGFSTGDVDSNENQVG
jgi:penicillin-binding protein 2